MIIENKEGLADIYSQLADIVGVENTVMLYENLKGQQITFPMRLYKTDYIAEKVKKRYNGRNLKELAKEYDYSERHLRSFLKDDIRYEKRNEADLNRK